jgi:hypothetical protein
MFDRSRPYMKYSIPEVCQITADRGENEKVALSPKFRSRAGSYRKRGRGLTATTAHIRRASFPYWNGFSADADRSAQVTA